MENQQLQGDLFNRLQSMCKLNKFQIQKLYFSMLPEYNKVEWKNVMLTSNVQPRHKFTVWLAAHHRLPTTDRLQKYGIQVPTDCIFCQQHAENFEHLYFDCQVTSRLWNRICCWLGYKRTVGRWEDELQWICSIARSKQWHKAITASAFVTAVALIWRDRNCIRFDGKAFIEDQFCWEVALLLHIRGRKCKKWKDGLRLLNGNRFSGSLTNQLGYLLNLRIFQIDQNQISGSIPKSFSHLNSMQHIHFNNNSLSGQIPKELSNISTLIHLLLDSNNLSGYLPPEFSAFPSIRIIQLDNNNFSRSNNSDFQHDVAEMVRRQALFPGGSEFQKLLHIFRWGRLRNRR